jgi:hypothetical protein
MSLLSPVRRFCCHCHSHSRLAVVVLINQARARRSGVLSSGYDKVRPVNVMVLM